MRVAVIGAGPAGLMAADVLSAHGIAVTIHERMASPGRKFLMAGRGGLNLTHSEPLERLLGRYTGSVGLDDTIRAYSPENLRALADGLGEDTFVGSSGRVFPRSFKASPFLRAWLARLRDRGVTLATRETLSGFDGARPLITAADGVPRTLDCDATVLAMGGASWPRLGSNGAWADTLLAHGVDVAPLRPANVGVCIAWSDATRDRHAGHPVKRVGLTFGDTHLRGEIVITQGGLEGSAIYALSSAIRDALDAAQPAVLRIDLAPDLTLDAAVAKLSEGRAKDSRANALRKRLGLSPAALALLRESAGGPLPTDLTALAERVKNVALAIVGVAGLDRAISTAGGVTGKALDDRLMLRDMPGVFVAGEMLDWDAPTGGYLLQASFASGAAAARGALTWLEGQPSSLQG